MAKRSKKRNVVKMKRRAPVFTGFILLLFSIYLISLTVRSATKEHIAIYEVTEKKIADDNTVRGIILRDEKLVECEQSGYVNYYVGEGAKVGTKSPIYSVDQGGQIYDQLTRVQSENVKLSSRNTEDIRSQISAYRDNYDLSHFEDTYNFKYNIENMVSQLSNSRLMDNLTEILNDSVTIDAFSLVNAGESGIVSYTSDGMEELDLNQVTPESFLDTSDKLTQLRKTESIEAGTPVYKLVTSENWSVIAPLSEEQFRNIQQQDHITVILKKIHARITPQMNTFTMDGGYYVKLDLNRFMIQYLNNRYLDLEIEMNDDDGLKIPLSSLLKKTYYRIPQKFVQQGAKGEGITVIVTRENGSTDYQFQASEILYDTTESEVDSTEEEGTEEKQEKKYAYVDAAQFPVGTSIAMDNLGSDVYQLSETVELEGVYCCNKGYCEFRRVEQSYQNSEYCIVKKDTPNGLAAYDHIILNPELIGENDIIY